MAHIPKPDYKAFLIERKFGDTHLPKTPPNEEEGTNPFDRIHRPDDTIEQASDDESANQNNSQLAEELARVQKYRNELDKLSESELYVLYKSEVAKKNAEDDQDRFFNKPSADADFDYWSKMTYWTLDEAIALSFGKSPNVVNQTRLSKIFRWTSPFVDEYQKTTELAKRALVWKKLYDPVLPSIFIKWTTDYGIPIPSELVKQVEARLGKAHDWQRSYKELLVSSKAESDKMYASFLEMSEQSKGLAATCDKWKAMYSKLESTIKSERKEAITLTEKLREEILGLAAQKTVSQKPLQTKERDTLLKLVIGMAIGGYGYDPKAKRSPTASEISDDLAKNGIALDTDTVRNWLKKAADHVPGPTEDEAS